MHNVHTYTCITNTLIHVWHTLANVWPTYTDFHMYNTHSYIFDTHVWHTLTYVQHTHIHVWNTHVWPTHIYTYRTNNYPCVPHTLTRMWHTFTHVCRAKKYLKCWEKFVSKLWYPGGNRKGNDWAVQRPTHLMTDGQSALGFRTRGTKSSPASESPKTFNVISL